MHRNGITARTKQSGRGDGARALKDQIAALGVTARDVKVWAHGRGLLDDPQKRGIPSATLVEAYAREHP